MRDKNEELYVNVQNEIRGLEEQREDVERSFREFEQDREASRAAAAADRGRAEALAAMWGISESSGRMMSGFEETLAQEHEELKKQEEELLNKRNGIRKRIAQCEEEYEAIRRKLNEEEEPECQV